MLPRWRAVLKVVRITAAASLAVFAGALAARAGLPDPFQVPGTGPTARLLLAQSGGLRPSSQGEIVRILSVGSVLTEDGTIWQYIPERGRWVTIDESFRLQDEKRTSHVLPLPVPVSAIRDMQTFGFILTDTGECWLYDLGKDSWKKLPAPGK